MRTLRTHPLNLRPAAALLAAIALGAGLAACGSSSDPSGAGSGASGSAGSAGAAAATTAATTSTVQGSSSGGDPTLVVGDQAGTGQQALLTAAGLLHKLPFTVKFADFTSGPPILEALSSGSLDIGGVGNAPPVFAAAGGAKIEIVETLRDGTRSAATLVPKGSSITSIQQLKGKKIAVAEGSSAEYHLLRVLEKAGLTPKDVTLENLQPAEALAAFSSGAVDAWDVWSPYIEQAEAQKGARILAGGSGFGTEYSYEVASKSAIANPTKAKEIKQYLAVLNQAHRWVDSHSAAWAKTWAAATGLPQSIMRRAAADDSQTPVPVNASTTTSAEQGLVTAFSKAGLIPKDYSFAPYVSTAFNSTVN